MPGVIISDFCRAFKNVCTAVFPGTQQQLCLWHINKNIALYIKKKWLGSGHNSSVPDAEDDEAPAEPKPRVPGPSAFHTGEEEMQALLDEAAAGVAVLSSLYGHDCNIRLEAEEASESPPLADQQPEAARKWDATHEGFLQAWRATVYVLTEEAFWAIWKAPVLEFYDQLRMCSLPQIICLANIKPALLYYI